MVAVLLEVFDGKYEQQLFTILDRTKAEASGYKLSACKRRHPHLQLQPSHWPYTQKSTITGIPEF